MGKKYNSLDSAGPIYTEGKKGQFSRNLGAMLLPIGRFPTARSPSRALNTAVCAMDDRWSFSVGLVGGLTLYNWGLLFFYVG